MNKDIVYNIIIVLLLISIVVVLFNAITNVSEAEQEKKYTELYFNEPELLDKYSRNGFHEFSFVISNFEGEDKEYEYEIRVNNKLIKTDKLFLENGASVTVYEYVKIATPFNKAKIEVSLPEKNQEIHFEVIYTTHLWLENEGREDSAIECVSLNKVKYGDVIILNARGSYANGWPLLGVWIDGNKIKEIELKGDWQDYLIYGPINDSTRIDLIFDNDFRIKEEDIVTWDRNIYLNGMRTMSKKLGFIYDKGDLDCENIKDGDMYSNGALRLRVIPK